MLYFGHGKVLELMARFGPFLHIVFFIPTAGPYSSSYCWSWISYLRYNLEHICLKTQSGFLLLMIVFFRATYIRQKTSSTVKFSCIFVFMEHKLATSLCWQRWICHSTHQILGLLGIIYWNATHLSVLMHHNFYVHKYFTLLIKTFKV